MSNGLDGKRAIVTGGGTGIGYAVALELARANVSVAITSRRAEVLEKAAATIRAEVGAEVLTVVADTGDDESVANLVATVNRELGGIDILVNNAAEQPAQHGSSYTDATDEWFQRQINVKVIGYLRTIRAVAPTMIASGWGRIINISGTGSRQTVSVIGSVRNASVTALTKNVADELGPHGINVTVVHPGATRTERYEELQRTSAFSESVRARLSDNVIGRVVEPEEVAWVVAFLASPRSVAITGDGIVAGGGVPGFIYY
ncbi:SDR family NAD(P)-dependent oxidoreductase [Pseudonocardia endophytica]|uniref:NAD(P)-dependent dehydrogenase (Short-subunit alcohol dehydrogenase family) n=1 Tax=Pseudonocardia endophytica TaxID=401976 RepID=A0A4R1HXS7_PSEEN|nr:SDR family oxidoreductase [Pseudonocardia endophytica]TCK26323.1 NAD(P)-dependent dehydrogenase (short-subunit alcohol dehydrogenase family) [Pseudonocardia endophytica]